MFYLNKIFKPVSKIDLKRIGNKNDGGYLLNLKDIEYASNFYSFGIGMSWDFESEIYNLKKNQNKQFKIYMFDHSISNYFWFKNLIISFVELFFLKKKFFNYLLKFFQLKKFIRKKECVLNYLMISPVNLKHANIYKLKTTDLNEILRKEKKERNNFIKIDIEGSEYRILDQLILNQDYLNGLIIEFHDVDIHIEKIKKFIQDFDLNLIHCHVNNCGPIKDERYPTNLEITFSYTGKDNIQQYAKNFELPHKLDMPNNPKLRNDKIIYDS